MYFHTPAYDSFMYNLYIKNKFPYIWCDMFDHIANVNLFNKFSFFCFIRYTTKHLNDETTHKSIKKDLMQWVKS